MAASACRSNRAQALAAIRPWDEVSGCVHRPLFPVVHGNIQGPADGGRRAGKPRERRKPLRPPVSHLGMGPGRVGAASIPQIARGPVSTRTRHSGMRPPPGPGR
jgi:hypothetical protein